MTESNEFGGFAEGIAARNNRGLDSATDRLEQEINRFSDALEKFSGKLGSSSGAAAGPASGNGGGVTFSGVAAAAVARAAPTTATSEAGGQGAPMGWAARGNGGHPSGAHQGPTSWAPSQTGGVHATQSTHSQQVRQGLGVAAKVGVAGVAAATIYGGNHASSQTTGATLAMMNRGQDGSWSSAYKNTMGNYTAHGDTDQWAMISMMNQRSGYTQSSRGYRQQMEQYMSQSAVNPALSNAQAVSANQSMAAVGVSNRARAFGIDNLTSDKMTGDTRAVARQILSRIGGYRIKNVDQIEAAFSPGGGAQVTLESYQAAGIITSDARPAIEQEMKNILRAQVKGMDYKKYDKLAKQANASNEKGEAARKTLDEAGIATETVTQKEARAQGQRREAEIHTIEGFVKGVDLSTDALSKFREVIDSILDIPGVGGLVGGWGGISGRLPGLGSLLNFSPAGTLSKLIPGVGDGPSSASAYATNYGPASGAGAAGKGFGPSTGTASATSARGSGVASTGSSQRTSSRYTLGGVKPWVAKAASIMGPMFGIGTIYGVGSRSGPSDHPKGLALDFMCGKSAGDRLSAYAVANHKKLNITYVIWRQRIWSINNPSWRGMEDRGSPTANHMDHVHVSFLASPANGDYDDLPAPGTGSAGAGSTGTGIDPGLAGAGVGSGVTADPLASGSGGASNGGVTSSGYAMTGSYSEVAALASVGAGSAITGGGLGAPGTTIGPGTSSGGGGSGWVDPVTGQPPVYFDPPKGGGSAPGTNAPAPPGLTGNRALGYQRAANRGWTGEQWKALEALWTKESGWRTEADNPTSSAYGIPQALISAHRGTIDNGYYRRVVSGSWDRPSTLNFSGGDPHIQIEWGLDYIRDRYGTPAKAWAEHKRKGWYREGAWNITEDHEGTVHQEEMILPAHIARVVRSEVSKGGSRSAGGVVFQAGSIVVQVQGAMSTKVATTAGRQIVDAIVEDSRFKALAEGR